MDYKLSPVPGSYREKFRFGFPSVPLRLEVMAVFSNGHTRRYSITFDGTDYVLVDFDDFSSKGVQRYKSFNRAYDGISFRARRYVRSMNSAS